MRRKPFAALLTEQEKAEIELAAKAMGVSVSWFLRDSALARARGVPEMAPGEAEGPRD